MTHSGRLWRRCPARAGWAAATHMSDVARSGARRRRTRVPVPAMVTGRFTPHKRVFTPAGSCQ
jgi:hypothetical protein